MKENCIFCVVFSVMMMMVDFENADTDIDRARKDLTAGCAELGVECNVMNERVFSAMHRI